MKDLLYFTVENTWLTRGGFIKFGWGNGYVAVPKGHPLFGLSYYDIDVDVHGGITFADSGMNNALFPDWVDDSYWVFGFDTAHASDNLEKWSESNVLEETIRFKKLLEKISETM